MSMLTLILALILVESSGNNLAVNGDCWGCLQIRPIYVEDVNRIAGTRFTHADAFDRQKSIQMFRIYTSHYATPERLGRLPTIQDIARIHAGGPNGWRDPATRPYWQKVLSKLPAAQRRLPSEAREDVPAKVSGRYQRPNHQTQQSSNTLPGPSADVALCQPRQHIRNVAA